MTTTGPAGPAPNPGDTEPGDVAGFAFPWDAILAEDLAPYPDLAAFCVTLLRARDAMLADVAAGGDPRWAPVAQWLEESADRVASDDPCCPREAKTAGWLERNERIVLQVARTFTAS